MRARRTRDQEKETLDEETATIVLAGDVSFARDIAQTAIHRFNGNFTYTFAHVNAILRSADIASVNLETALLPHSDTSKLMATRKKQILLIGDRRVRVPVIASKLC